MNKPLTPQQKKLLNKAVKLLVQDYGETLRLLAKE